MIPTIETIVEDLIAAAITPQQAIAWLHRHAESAGRDLRDDFAAAALSACVRQCAHDTVPDGMTREDWFALAAYRCADAMLKARKQ